MLQQHQPRNARHDTCKIPTLQQPTCARASARTLVVSSAAFFASPAASSRSRRAAWTSDAWEAAWRLVGGGLGWLGGLEVGGRGYGNGGMVGPCKKQRRALHLLG
jgi:hypothetical protein